MTSRNWLKDVLLISVGLAAIGAVTVYLIATDRVKQPISYAAGNSSLATSISSVAERLDYSIATNAAKLGLQTTDRATDLNIARRLSLALTGTLPSVEEIRAVENIDPSGRVDWFVSHLLEDRRCSDYLAERLARVFVGVEEGPFLVYRRRRFVSWLSEQLYANRPYNKLSQQILTDDGLWTDSPAVNFYTSNIIPDVEQDNKPDPIRLAGRTSRAFLGMRIDCLQCHDDFIGTINLGSVNDPQPGQQLDFHSLASFFSQVENTLLGIKDNPEAKEYSHQLLDTDQAEMISATVPFNADIDNRSESNLRIRLANWVTHPQNRPFARATVNRVWAIMFGVGLIQPVDDIPLEGPWPAILEMLVDDFVTNNFDLQRLIRIIAASDTFQRASSADFEITDEHVSHWATFPLTRLRPEQVAGSIIQSTTLTTIDSTTGVLSRLMRFGQEFEFVNRFGDTGEDEFNPRSETITQRLLMLNGDMIRERLDNELNSVSRIGQLAPGSEKALETVYLSTLSRPPSAAERVHFVEPMTRLNNEQIDQRIKDIYWTLINSTEFTWNH